MGFKNRWSRRTFVHGMGGGLFGYWLVQQLSPLVLRATAGSVEEEIVAALQQLGFNHIGDFFDFKTDLVSELSSTMRNQLPQIVALDPVLGASDPMVVQKLITAFQGILDTAGPLIKQTAPLSLASVLQVPSRHVPDGAKPLLDPEESSLLLQANVKFLQGQGLLTIGNIFNSAAVDARELANLATELSKALPDFAKANPLFPAVASQEPVLPELLQAIASASDILPRVSGIPVDICRAQLHSAQALALQQGQQPREPSVEVTAGSQKTANGDKTTTTGTKAEVPVGDKAKVKAEGSVETKNGQVTKTNGSVGAEVQASDKTKVNTGIQIENNQTSQTKITGKASVESKSENGTFSGTFGMSSDGKWNSTISAKDALINGLTTSVTTTGNWRDGRGLATLRLEAGWETKIFGCPTKFSIFYERDLGSGLDNFGTFDRFSR